MFSKIYTRKNREKVCTAKCINPNKNMAALLLTSDDKRSYKVSINLNSLERVKYFTRKSEAEDFIDKNVKMCK